MKRNKDWSGYTMDELRFQRMLNMTRIQVEVNALKAQYNEAANPNPKVQTFFSRISNSIGYINYFLLAFRIGKKIYSFFKK